MATLTVQTPGRAGAQKAALVAASAGGDVAFNDGKTVLEIANGDVSPMTLTVTAVRNSRLGTSEDITVTVPAGETWLVGPFPVGTFNTDGANQVQFEYSSVTSLTVGVYSVNDKFN